MAVLEWVDCLNKTRLHSKVGYVSPFKFEKRYDDHLTLSGIAACLKLISLRQSRGGSVFS
ncbi:hypothetical protein IP510_07650 [Psychrobacter sp. NG254]|nr:hypothetical protein [Psychrobacter sp. NG254]